jgi:uncharacterized protein (UPF0332 family)
MGEGDADAAIEEARTLLSDVRAGRNVGVSENTAVNRLYYACFHAARAVLYDRGIEPKSHNGMKSQLGEELVPSGDISKQDAGFYSEMADYRDRADYAYYPVPADVDDLLERTEEFVETMEALLDNPDE